MSLYLITYDLKKPRQNYIALYDEIKKSFKWWHYLDSTWIVHTHENANQIYSRLRVHLDENDFILVTQLGYDKQGWLPQDAWDWLTKNT